MRTTVFQWVSIVSGVLAALFWYLSAAVKGTWDRFQNSQEDAFKRRNIYSRIAAAFAIIAAGSALALLLID